MSHQTKIFFQEALPEEELHPEQLHRTGGWGTGSLFPLGDFTALIGSNAKLFLVALQT